MPYIKVSGESVTLGGMVKPNEDGWFMYEGEIPQGTRHLFVNDQVVLAPVTIEELKQARDKSLSGLTHTFADGSIVQVRPSDLSTFQLSIAQGQDEDWVMADDTVRLLTVAEMTEAMESGIAQGKVIWNDYTTKLKTL